MSLTEIFSAGGVVMWPLLLFSLGAIAVTIERGLFWFRVKKQEREFAKDILQIYRANPSAVFAKLKQHIDLPIARIFLEALELEGASPNQFRLALESATQAELPTNGTISQETERRRPMRVVNNEADEPLTINILPMVDVIFAILAFFIISTLFLTRSEGFSVDLPEAEIAQSQTEVLVTVTVEENGDISIDKESVSVGVIGSDVGEELLSGSGVGES